MLTSDWVHVLAQRGMIRYLSDSETGADREDPVSDPLAGIPPVAQLALGIGSNMDNIIGVGGGGVGGGSTGRYRY
jgi:hypothetical protein